MSRSTHLDHFVQQLADRLRVTPDERERVIREMCSHLDERVDELLLDGWRRESAERVALAELGEATQLAGRLSQAMQGRRHWPRRLLAGLGVAASLLVMVQPFLIRNHDNPSEVSNMRQASAMNAGVAVMMTGLVAGLSQQANAVPVTMNHQGVITVSGERFTGTGSFKFALFDPDSNLYVWANDGATTTGEPATAVGLTVTDGIYSVKLGDASLLNMAALDPADFADDNLKLRIWFSHTGSGFEQLAPDHALASSPYAFMAQNIVDGAVSEAKLANNAVTANKIATDAVAATRLATDSASLSKVSGGLMVNASGKLGIGEPTPIRHVSIYGTNAALGIKDSASNRSYVFTNKASGDQTMGVYDENAGKFRIVITSAGNIALADFYPSHPLHLHSGAHCTAGGVWTNASSREYKDNITPLSRDEALQAFASLRPVQFNYRAEECQRHVGFIAEDVPELVATPDRKGLSPMDITAVLTKVVQEQQATIEQLQRQVSALQQRLDDGQK